MKLYDMIVDIIKNTEIKSVESVMTFAGETNTVGKVIEAILTAELDDAIASQSFNSNYAIKKHILNRYDDLASSLNYTDARALKNIKDEIYKKLVNIESKENRVKANITNLLKDGEINADTLAKISKQIDII
jgi:uncharacterized membrane protein